MKTKKALIVLHSGFEEMETAAPIDLLARADIELTIASMTKEKLVRGRNGLVFQATHSLAELDGVEFYDCVVIPGGPGIKEIRGHSKLCDLLRAHHSAGKLIACICAAPLILHDAGILPEHYTAHPSTSSELLEAAADAFVWCGNILTSRGAGTATEFSLALVEALTDTAIRDQIAEAICLPST